MTRSGSGAVRSGLALIAILALAAVLRLLWIDAGWCGVDQGRDLAWGEAIATGHTYSNVAEVTASDQFDPDSQPDPIPDNNPPTQDDEGAATVTPTAVADLSLVKSVNNPTANVGSTVTFTIAVTNNGPSTATNVAVGDVIPSGFAYVANSISGGSTRSDAGAPTLSWTIASLASGNTVNLTFQAIVNATGPYANVAQVTASDQLDPDSSPNNNNGPPFEDDEGNRIV